MSGKKWTKDELLILNYWVQYERLDQVAERLDRTECAVRDKCRRLGLSLRQVRRVKLSMKPSAYRPENAWTEEEITKLRKGVLKKTLKELSEELGRSVAGVNHKLKELGISVRKVRGYIRRKKRPSDDNWTKKDIKFLKDNAGVLTSKEIGEALGKHPKSVRGYACRRGISLKKGGWSEEEIETLERCLSEGRSWEEIEKVLGRGVEALRAKANYQDFEYKTSRWSEADVQSLLKLTEEGKTSREIAEILGRTPKSVRKKYSRLT